MHCIFCLKELKTESERKNIFESKKSMGKKHYCNSCKPLVERDGR